MADTISGKRTLVGEARFLRKPPTETTLRHEAARLASRSLPPAIADRDVVRALFVPRANGPRLVAGIHVVTLRDLVGPR